MLNFVEIEGSKKWYNLTLKIKKGSNMKRIFFILVLAFLFIIFIFLPTPIIIVFFKFYWEKFKILFYLETYF